MAWLEQEIKELERNKTKPETGKIMQPFSFLQKNGLFFNWFFS